MLKTPEKCLYMIINMSDWKFYLGGTIIGVFRRYRNLWNGEYYDLTQHHNIILSRAAHKYGNEAFKIIVLKELTQLTQKEILEEEQDAIDFLLANDMWKFCYNIAEEVSGGYLGVDVYKKVSKTLVEYYKSQDARKKTSVAVSKYYENKENRDKHKVTMNKPETVKKISIATSKRFENPDERKRQSNAVKAYNKKHNINKKEDTKATKAKKSASASGEKNSQAKLTRADVEQIRLDEKEWTGKKKDFYKQQAEKYFVKPQTIEGIIKGHRWKQK